MLDFTKLCEKICKDIGANCVGTVPSAGGVAIQLSGGSAMKSDNGEMSVSVEITLVSAFPSQREALSSLCAAVNKALELRGVGEVSGGVPIFKGSENGLWTYSAVLNISNGENTDNSSGNSISAISGIGDIYFRRNGIRISLNGGSFSLVKLSGLAGEADEKISQNSGADGGVLVSAALLPRELIAEVIVNGDLERCAIRSR